MVPEQSWYVISGGLEQGPFTPAAVRTLVQRGQIVGTTLVRRGDQPAPVAAATIKGLIPTPGTEAYTPDQLAAAPAGGRKGAPAAAVGKAVDGSKPVSNSKNAAASGPSGAGGPGGKAPAPARKPAAPSTTGRSARASAPEPEPEESEEPAEADLVEEDLEIPEGRADVGQRFRSMLIDLVLVGVVVGGLGAWAYLTSAGAELKAIDAIEAQRLAQSAAHANDAGSSARPTYRGWPSIRDTLVAELADKKAEAATADAAADAFTPPKEVDPTTGKPKPPKIKTPEQSENEAKAKIVATNLHNEVDYRAKNLEYEDNSYAKEGNVVRQAVKQAQGNSTLIAVFAAAIGILLLPFIEFIAGGTPGKLAGGLRTVGQGRKAVGVVPAFIRHAARLVPIGYLQLSRDPQWLTWHDRISHTEVVVASAVARKKRGATTRVARR